MSSSIFIRPIEPKDLVDTLELYRPYVESGPYSLEYEVPDLKEWGSRVEAITARYPWLVCLEGKRLIGYTYASQHRARIGYSWVAETSIYLAPAAQEKGIGTRLYQALFAALRSQGIVGVIAIIGLPNDQSERFHQKLGFELVGTFRKIGFKAGSWQDTRCYQLQFQSGTLTSAKGDPV